MWWIHGSQERYVWIISGPDPYSMFGSGPFQLFVYLGLAFLGLVTVLVAAFFRLWLYDRIY